jgi:hypothetical protein
LVASPIGQHFESHSIEEKGERISPPKKIKSDVGDMTADVSKMQYDRIFEGCDASTQHLTPGWGDTAATEPSDRL